MGAIIWLFSEMAFDLVSKVWPHNILPSYIALFILIAMGTMLGSWVLGVNSLLMILIIWSIAELCGLSITIIYRAHYKKVLNQQLEHFKKNENNQPQGNSSR